MLMLVYHDLHEETALGRQIQAVEHLLGQMKSTSLVYCDDGENWRIAFAVLLAERELARLRAPAAR